MKDPAFLFYTQDFLVGTMTMSFEDRGRYITILSLMHQQGRMAEETIRLLVGSVSVTLKSKFSVDENGLWYNVRLEKEVEKREKFIESRVSNGKLGGRPRIEEKPLGLPNGKPLGLASENLIENENVNINITNSISTIIDYLNNKTSKSFRSKSDKTKKIIEARLKEKWSVEDFKSVIDFKCSQWLNDPKFSEYLRPETLFGSKFESYLNSIPKKTTYKPNLAR